MKTFQQFEQQLKSIPLTTSWYLADLGEARDKQELFTTVPAEIESPAGARRSIEIPDRFREKLMSSTD
jgi:hypothetical protein